MRQLRVCDPPVRCLAYSPDGRWLATGDEGGCVRLWSLPSCDQAAPFDDLGAGSVEALAFHPSGKMLAVGLDRGEILLLDLATRHAFPGMRLHELGVRALAWSGDGKSLASSSWDSTVRLWSASLQEVAVSTTGEVVMGLAFVPGGHTLAMVGQVGTLQLSPIDKSRTGRVREAYSLLSVALAPSGGLVATGGSRGAVALWELPDLQKVATLAGHEWSVYGLAFSPSGGTLVSGAADGAVCVWDVPTRRLVETFRWHSRWVTCVGVAPDGMTAAAGSADGTVVIWDLV